jgi:eukaryotic-like serine/threonine-protein kinase
MTQSWDRIQSLFLEALDLPPEERPSFLDRACAGDQEVRREVESLIAHDSTDERQIAEALEDTAQSLLESEDLSGSRLGVWRVIKEIGHGGMGTVYLACRDDDQFQKHVAIKVVTRGMDTAELLRRFRHERQILAHLDHPYIARLIDGGNTQQGRPFLVMEYVQGRPIDLYCRQDGLDINARCRLFLKVCQAVAYAHRNLVIHRDLKPGNILIATDGSPKLLDFGVAKLLDPEVDPRHAATIAGVRMITPEYASPEQVLGELVGTSSDIYALGAVLYELLTGVKAHQLTSHSPSELQHAICEVEVKPPSSRVSPDNPRLRKQLSGDLDNIVLMAMRIEPEQRYSSVDLFAKDIGRYLKGRTVTARPPSLTYRFGKFASRHRLSLAFAVLVVLSLIGGTWASLVEAHHARIEQQRAEARLSQMVELANRALFDVHGSIERLPGALDARRQLVKTTLDYLQNLSKDAGDDEKLRKALAMAYYRLGDLQGYPFAPNLGDTSGAIQSYRNSVALVEPLHRAHPKDSEAQQLWLQSQERLAVLLEQTAGYGEAEKLLNEGLPTAEALTRLPGANVDAKRIQGEFYQYLAEAEGRHDHAKGLLYARRYLEIFSDLTGQYPDRADFILEQSNGYVLVGRFLQRQGDIHAVLDVFLKAVSLREELVKTHPKDVIYKRNLMIGYGHVGDVLGNTPIVYSLGDSAGAQAYYRKAVAIGQELYDADPNDRTAKFDLAAGLERLGMVEASPSDAAESLASLKRSAAILEGLVADDPKSTSRKRMLALTLEYAGRRFQTLGRYSEAIPNCQRSLALAEALLATDPADQPAMSQAIASGRVLATSLALSGNRTAALKQAQATLAQAEASGSHDKRSIQRNLAEATIELGSIYEILAKHSAVSQQKQDWQLAQSALSRSISVLETIAAGDKLFSIETTDLQEARNLLAEADKHLPTLQHAGH